MLFCATFVEARVERVEILRVQAVGGQLQSLAEALIVYHLARTQEFQRLAHVGVVDQAQQVIVGRARLLLGGQILRQVGDRVAFDTDIFRTPRQDDAACGYTPVV